MQPFEENRPQYFVNCKNGTKYKNFAVLLRMFICVYIYIRTYDNTFC